MKTKTKLIILLILVTVCSLFIWWRYYFVFGEGVKGGDLNILEKKGIMFKTWEGKIIQEGFKANAAGTVQSNEFDFSVADQSVAEKLERASGKFVEVRYKEYHSSIFFRGNSNFVVIEVLDIKEPEKLNTTPLK